ncbi:MAG: hypothetical protein ABFS46_22655, partial [Myxococcota bacterium]
MSFPQRAPFLSWRYAILGLAVALVGVALRVHNAFDFPIDKGFDAMPNWDYIALLMDGWRIPGPEEGWATYNPPFYYWLAAGMGRLLGGGSKDAVVIAARLLSSGVGLVAVGFAVALVRRNAAAEPRRVFLAGALLLLLPVHVYTSAMLTAEILVASLISLVSVGVAWDLLEGGTPRARLVRAAVLGVGAGLAFLTKLSGVLVILAACSAWAIEGWKMRRPAEALGRIVVFGACAAAAGGWFYLHNLIEHGYLYPYGLGVHSVMFSMPPGSRSLMDYLWVPWATLSTPNPLAPQLLHSVWGATYTTVWFEAHRHFLPASGPSVIAAGTLLGLLGLLPTAAFLVGLWRGVRRVGVGSPGADTILVPLVAVTLAGYVAFTWRNPWYVTLKASFLLGLMVPFAYYTSEALSEWTRGRLRAAVWCLLGLLGLLS